MPVIRSTAVARDLSQTLNEYFFKSNVNFEVKEEGPGDKTTNANALLLFWFMAFSDLGKGLGGYCIFMGRKRKMSLSLPSRKSFLQMFA